MFYVVLVFSSIVCGGGTVTCPTTQSVERMDNKTIACSADGVIERCFWYLGSNTKTPPILYYEIANRVKGGTRLSDDTYDITSECGMRIINAQIIHEGNYTFLAFFKNGTDWQQVISILVTVTPSQLHPVISTCNGSDSCILTASENEIGTLTCYIDGIRPAAKLYWKYEGALTIINNRSYSEPSDAVSDTWNSSATLQYTLPCGEDVVMYCRSNERNITTEDVNIVSECSHSATSVNISQKTSNSICQRKPHICLITFGTLAGSFCIAVIYVILSRRKANKEETAETSGPSQYESLMRNLKRVYTDRFITETGILYTSCEVANKYPNNNSDVKTSDEIFETSFLSKNNRILLIGASGYGKTFCFQQLLSKWIKGDAMPSVLLIYLQLRFLSSDSNILREITTMLTETSISVQTVNELLKSKQSLILLDGLDHLDFTQRLASDTVEDNMDHCILTVNDLLQNDIASYPNMNVWVCSGLFEYDGIFKGPFTLVSMCGFTKKQRNELFWRTTEHSFKKIKFENNCSNGEPLAEEKNPLLPQSLETVEVAWDKCYRNSGKDNASPLVVYLFASNFLKSEETLLISNSTSHKKVSWDTKNFTVDLSQTDWHLLACLFKSCDQDAFKRKQFKSLFGGCDMIFEKGKDGFNENAMTEICLMCRKFSVELDTLTFWKECPTALIKYLPTVKNGVIFKEITIEKRKFITLINTLTEGVPTLSFVDCEIPDDLPKNEFKVKKDISGMADNSTKVLRKQGKETYLFDFEDATWTKQTIAETKI